MASICVCDDSPAPRDALLRAVSTMPGVHRVISARSGEELLRRAPAERPDLVLLDVRMPGLNGVETLEQLLNEDPDVAVLMLSIPQDVHGVYAALRGGALGWLRKDATREELVATVSQALSEADARRRPHRALDPALGTPPTLTQREVQVLIGMSRGQSNGEIGKELYLAEDTVKTHAKRLFRKIGASDRAHAVALAFRWGLIN
jgi:DNA-binding NarL/FixJ family response regulator